MGWAIAIFGGLMVYGAFDDNVKEQPIPWGGERLSMAIIGVVLIITGVIYSAVRDR